MPTAIALITLLTDFGDRDHFVASMKGVILTINSQVRIVDLSHRVPPQQIEDAAYVLKYCYRHFPDGTIHVAVVDPGVGSSRRPLLVNSSHHFFLAPDNGLLTPIYEEEASVEVRVIENKQYRLDSAGMTFDGRDLFAPAAAWLTRGRAPSSFGRLTLDYVKLPRSEPFLDGNMLIGQIAYVDHFGNLITNFTAFHVKAAKERAERDQVVILVGGTKIEGLSTCYAEGDSRKPRALINSNGQVEIFLKEGNCAKLLASGQGDRAVLS